MSLTHRANPEMLLGQLREKSAGLRSAQMAQVDPALLPGARPEPAHGAARVQLVLRWPISESAPHLFRFDAPLTAPRACRGASNPTRVDPGGAVRGRSDPRHEYRDKPHETVTRRMRIDRVGLEKGGSFRPRMIDRSFEQTGHRRDTGR